MLVDTDDPRYQEGSMYAAKGYARDRVRRILRDEPALSAAEVLTLLEADLEEAITKIEERMDQEEAARTRNP